MIEITLPNGHIGHLEMPEAEWQSLMKVNDDV